MYRSSSYRSFVPIDTLASSPSPVPTVIDWNDSCSDFDDSDSSDVSVLMANDHSQPASPSRSISPAPHHTTAVPRLTRTSFPPDSATSQSIRTPSPASTNPATVITPLFVRNSWGSEMSASDVASVLGIRIQDAQSQRENPKEPKQSLDLQQILSSEPSSSHSLFTPPSQAQSQVPTPPRQEFGSLVERLQAASITASPPPTPSPEPPAYMEDSAVLTEPPSLANTPPQQQQQPRPSTRQPALPSWFMDRYIAPPVMHTATFSPTPYPVGVPPRPPSDTSYLSYTRPSPSPYQSNTNDRHVGRAPPSREMSPSRPLSSASSSSSGRLFATPRAPSHSPGSGRFGGRSAMTYSMHEPYLPPPNFGLFEGSTISTATPSPSWSPAFAAPALPVRIPSLTGAPSHRTGVPASRTGAPFSRAGAGAHPSQTDGTPRRPPLARSVSTPSPNASARHPTPTFPKRARFAPNQYYHSPETFPAGGSGAQDNAQSYGYGNNTTSEPPFWDTPPLPSPPPLAPPSVNMNQTAQRGIHPPPVRVFMDELMPHIGQGHGGVNTNTPGSYSFAQATPRTNPTATNTNNNTRHPSDTTPGSRPGYYHTPSLGPIPAPALSTPSWYLPSLSWPPSAAASQLRLVPPLSLPTGNQINVGGAGAPGVSWMGNGPAQQQPINGSTPMQQQPSSGSTQQPGSTAWGQQQQQQQPTVNASTPWSSSSATPWLLQTPGAHTSWQPFPPVPWQQSSSAPWQSWQPPSSAAWQSVNTPWQQSINGPWQQQGGLSTPWQRANNESMEQASAAPLRRHTTINGSATFGQHPGASAPWQPSVNATPWQQPVIVPINTTPWQQTSWLGGSTPRRRELPPRPPLLNYHPRFTFPDGTVLFKVEDVTYKVHRYFFDQHSTFFQTLLQSYPPYSGAATVDPIFLQDVTRTDFERLLSVFYPLNFVEPDLKTTAEWTSVLALSSKWVFSQLRQRAIKELEKLAGPTDRILLAKKYTIKEWYLPAYKELCIRRQAMTLEDGQKLGLDTVIKVWEMQQEFECLEECCDEMHVAKVKERFGLE